MAYSEKDEAHYQSWLAKQSAMGRPVPVGGVQYPTAVSQDKFVAKSGQEAIDIGSITIKPVEIQPCCDVDCPNCIQL